MLLPLPSYHSPSLSLPSFQPSNTTLTGFSCSKASLHKAIEALTPTGSSAVYLHGSNSASLSTFSPERPDALRGCLLSLADLKSEGMTVESGEQSCAQFAGAYDHDHQGVSAFQYQSGWNDSALDEVGDYCGYNCTGERYPVLYVISEEAGFEEVGYGESQCPRVSPEHLLGVLVPTARLDDAIARVTASGLNVRVAGLSD